MSIHTLKVPLQDYPPPPSYMTEAQGRTYHCNRHHLCPIHIDTTPFSRPSVHQGSPIPGPLISEPSSNKDTRPSSRTPPQTAHFFFQKDQVKQSKQSQIPTLKCPASSRCSLTTNPPINNHSKSISCIPTSQPILLPRPSGHSNNPVPTSQIKYASNLTRPSTKTHNNPTI